MPTFEYEGLKIGVDMGKYEQLVEALRILGLSNSATLREIKDNYRAMLKRWHPDLCKENEGPFKEKVIEIIEAYRIIMDYCAQYRFSFSREEVEKYISPEELWIEQFGRDPIWSNHDSIERD